METIRSGEATEAGVELDALVSEHVMGWKVTSDWFQVEDAEQLEQRIVYNDERPHIGWLEIFDCGMDGVRWQPSSKIADAWEVFTAPRLLAEWRSPQSRPSLYP